MDNDINAGNILRLLQTNPPCQLAQLAPERGIYALYDHEKQMRYVGIAKTSFQNTLWNNKRQIETVNPETMVKAFTRTLNWPPEKLDAIQRQSERWKSMGIA